MCIDRGWVQAAAQVTHDVICTLFIGLFSKPALRMFLVFDL